MEKRGVRCFVKKNFKNVIIVILCITIICMGIGFMALSMRLEGYRGEEEVFDVRFSSVRMLTSIKGGTKEPKGSFEIDESGKVLDMNFSFYEDHDEVDYEVTILNAGTVEASIVDLFASPDYQDPEVLKSIAPISIQISDISGKILEPGEETTAKISATYKKTENSTTNKSYQLSGKLALLANSKK